MATGLSAMEIPTRILFLGDAVYTLKKGQDPEGLQMPPVHSGLQFLELEEIPIYVTREDLEEHGLEPGDMIDYPYLHVITRDKCAIMIMEEACSFRF